MQIHTSSLYVITGCFFYSTKGRLIVLCLDHMQNSDSGSMTFCSKPSISSQRTSPFREIVGFAAEQLSSSSLCSSPDDGSCDGIKLEETESWQLRVAHSITWPGMVLAVCPYLDRYFLASAGNAVSCKAFLMLQVSWVNLIYDMAVADETAPFLSVLCMWVSKW